MFNKYTSKLFYIEGEKAKAVATSMIATSNPYVAEFDVRTYASLAKSFCTLLSLIGIPDDRIRK